MRLSITTKEKEELDDMIYNLHSEITEAICKSTLMSTGEVEDRVMEMFRVVGIDVEETEE